MSTPGVLAVLVTHGSGSWLRDALGALAEQTYDDLTVVVATVGDVAVPTPILPERMLRQVVELPPYTGFGQAVNEAVASVDDSAPYLLLIHDDAIPAPDVVELLVGRAEVSSDVAAVGAKLLEIDQPDVLQEVGGSIDRFAVRRPGIEPDEVDHGQHDEIDDVLFCSAACLLIRREAFADAGGLDPWMWPMYEDVDLGWRLRASGRRVVVEPRARVRHAAAMSRGKRRSAGRPFGPIGIRTSQERGRLRFMLKNYQALTLLLVLPQYAGKALFGLGVGLVRREFWRLRILLTAWALVARDLPQVIDARRRSGEAQLDDRELLHIAARRAATERRYERSASAEGFFDALRRVEERTLAFARDPVAWGGAVAIGVVLITLRGIIFGGTFSLGELRPFPALSGALGTYLARVRPEGFDLVSPGGPGIVLLGALRSLVGGRGPLAQKLVLLAPLAVAGFGAIRFGRVLGLGDRGRRWLAVLTMVNPVTLVLLRDGFVGPLVVWAASMWIAAAFLAPAPGDEGTRDTVRRRARWLLGWFVVAALHPPGVLWLAVLGLGLAAARHGDALTAYRLRLVGLGVAGSVVGMLPWSLEWFRGHGPLFGSFPGMIAVDVGGVHGALLGGGWPWAVWLVVAVIAAYRVGLTRTTVALLGLAGVGWFGGAMGLIPVPTALVAVGWCTVALLSFVARRVSDELRRYALGVRHVFVILVTLAVGVGWLGAAYEGMRTGVPARTLPVVFTNDQDTGRVLWMTLSGHGLLVWTTTGFTEELSAFPATTGETDRLVARALRAARDGQTHRLGGILALADVSHVVAFHPEARRGLGGQSDLSPQEEQAGAFVYRNDAWSGRAMLLADAPEEPLSPAGLADVVRDMRPLQVRTGPDARMTVDVPDDARGVLYLATGPSRGWRIGTARAVPEAAGVVTPAAGLEGPVGVEPPRGWWRWLYGVQGALFVALIVLWLGAVYLTGPEGPARPARTILDLRAPPFPRTLTVAPLLALFTCAWLGWAAPRAPATEPFLSAAWYCPPVGEGFTQRLAIANPSEVRVSYLVRPHLAAPPIESGVLTAHGRATIDVAPDTGAVIESYGRRVVVATEVGRDGLADASPCAAAARAGNVFPEGGRGATRAIPRLFESYVLYNPFPDLARASVRFIAPDETIAPPALADIRIGGGESVVVDPEEQFEPMIDLSADVGIWQGRAIVARRLRTAEQVTWSLAPDAQDGGILPRASTQDATTVLFGVNAAEGPGRLLLNITGDEGTLPEQSLDVEGRSRVSLDLNDPAPGLPEMIARVSADPPLILESLVVPDDRSTVSLMPPLRPASRWALPLAEDRTLVVVNPGNTNVRVEVTRLGPGGPIGPLTVAAGRTGELRLPGAQPFGVLVVARGGQVTAAVVGERGSLAGVPLG